MRIRIVFAMLVGVIVCSSAFGRQAPHSDNDQPPIAEIIRRFAEAETQNKLARNNYTFTQDFDLMTLGEAGSVTGRFHRVSDVVFDDRGNRFEKITFFPPSTLTTLQLTSEDMQDLAGVQPFAMTTEDLPKYQIDFVGKEKIDELTTYVFDVKPKTYIKGERYLEGRIWVDDQDLQIVKVSGRSVPEVGDQKFPHFESYRENIDGRFWFPTYVYADDVLEFKKGPSLRLKMTVRYTNYKKFSARIRLTDEGEPAPDEEGKPTGKGKTSTPPDQPPAPGTKPKRP
jgi:hypothetical protein